ncbi:glutathione S-transferase-like protein [Cercophora newfieldiana]|uniref:Glutathione S-transferase-like protein n=1 Tax=Cercophora newfieldiana TaxID=92897 RepID=A0AA39Y923_9PEZI|nr:glutathione S-transferase-like protein [Cercophora newfieldiana]
MASKRPKIKLYWLNESRAQRIVWLLEELGLDYEVVLFYRGENRFAPPELEKIHPLGKSPAVGITFPGQEKETVLVESGFIAQYLGEHFAQDTNLVPERYRPGEEGKPGGETEAWMRYQHLLHYAEGSLMPPLLIALILIVMKGPKIPFIIRPVVSSVADKVYAGFVQPNVKKHLSFVEKQLESAPNGGPYLCGEHLTIADILLSFPLEVSPARLGGFAGGNEKVLAPYPRLRAYVERLQKEKGCVKAKERVEQLEAQSKK